MFYQSCFNMSDSNIANNKQIMEVGVSLKCIILLLIHSFEVHDAVKAFVMFGNGKEYEVPLPGFVRYGLLHQPFLCCL